MMLSDARLVLALEFEAAGLKDSVLDAHLFRLEAVITTANNCCNDVHASNNPVDKHCPRQAQFLTPSSARLPLSKIVSRKHYQRLVLRS